MAIDLFVNEIKIKRNPEGLDQFTFKYSELSTEYTVKRRIVPSDEFKSAWDDLQEIGGNFLDLPDYWPGGTAWIKFDYDYIENPEDSIEHIKAMGAQIAIAREFNQGGDYFDVVVTTPKMTAMQCFDHQSTFKILQDEAIKMIRSSQPTSWQQQTIPGLTVIGGGRS